MTFMILGGRVDLSPWSSFRCSLKENETQRRRKASNFAGTCMVQGPGTPWVSIYFLEQEMPLKVIRPIGPLGLAHDLPFIKTTKWIIFLRFCCNASARARLEPCRPCGKSCWTGPRNLTRSGLSCGCHPTNLLCQVASCPTGFNIHFNTLCSNMFDNVCRITTFANL